MEILMNILILVFWGPIAKPFSTWSLSLIAITSLYCFFNYTGYVIRRTSNFNGNEFGIFYRRNLNFNISLLIFLLLTQGILGFLICITLSLFIVYNLQNLATINAYELVCKKHGIDLVDFEKNVVTKFFRERIDSAKTEPDWIDGS